MPSTIPTKKRHILLRRVLGGLVVCSIGGACVLAAVCQVVRRAPATS